MPEIKDPVPMATRVLEAAREDAVAEAASVIRRGGLVAFPTETVYGLGADARNPLAVARIFEVKRRPRLDPLIVHVADAESARQYGYFPEIAQVLMRRFWPGPLTLVVPKTGIVPPIVTAGLDTVAIRVPAHPAALALIRASECAVAAPSANIFGQVSPTEAGHVAARLSGLVDVILDGGRCAVGVESTILSLAGPAPRLLRSGGIAPEVLEEFVGALEWTAGAPERPESPGQFRSHYATRTPFELLKPGRRLPEPGPGERVGLLSFLPAESAESFTAVEVLSPAGDLREAAAGLFSAMHRLDAMDLDRIVAGPVPEHGLGIAIMDRLRRCAAARGSDSRTPGA
jgi:L-threonylcarbamoyladenylate synthase